jgi:predicted secreted protein
VPANVPTHRPHSDVICGFLERANLPDEVVAFAACVLDALSERFYGIWRQALEPAEYERDLKNFLRNDTRRTVHVSPDLIALAALSLAHGFLLDRVRSARHWSIKESGGMFMVREIEATTRAMLEDSDYGLFRISNDMVDGMLATMRKAKMAAAAKHDRRRTLSIILTGAATWSYGQQTPEPSP